MKKVLVIGESCRDVFIYCDALRLCPDVPVPVLNIKNEVDNPGMAKNVYMNIKSLMDDCDVITNENWYEITKTRYVDEKSNHTFFRVDTPHNISRIDLSKIDYNYEVIVISDYNRGFLHEDDIAEICSNHSTVFIDTKKELGLWVKDAGYIKINNVEYEKSKTIAQLPEIADIIIRTKGDAGCDYKGKNYPVNKVSVQDVSGAGDSFLAALVVKYVQTHSIEDSIMFANECASKVVKQRGVTVI